MMTVVKVVEVVVVMMVEVVLIVVEVVVGIHILFTLAPYISPAHSSPTPTNELQPFPAFTNHMQPQRERGRGLLVDQPVVYT